MKDKILAALEKFSKAMVQPLSYISVAGMILVVGVLITNSTVVGLLPFLGWGPIQLIGNLLYQCIMVIINNLGLIFAVGIAAALAKKDKHQAALIGLMAYFMFLVANNTTLSTNGLLAEPNAMVGLYGTGQSTVMGMQVTDMGVFSGIILGCLTGYVINKTCNASFKGYWSMYSGTRFSFTCMVAVAILMGVAACYIWPIVQHGITALTSVIANSGSFGLFLYGMLERLLIPTGLHHLVYAPFQFGDLGGTLQVGETTIVGAYPILMTELQMGVPFSDSIYYMGTGFAKTFGYIGICAAFYVTAKPENKKNIKNILIPLVMTACLSGITEPIDFMFAFAAPVLFFVHSVIAGTFVALLKLFNIHAMTTGLINSFVMNLAAGVERTNWPMMYVLALAEIIVYFVVFTFLIKKFNFKTPGREDTTSMQEVESTANSTNKVATTVLSSEQVNAIINGLGGKDNIKTVENCFTRLRVNVNDLSKVNDDMINQVKHSGIVKKGNDIQIIFGLEVPQIKKAVDVALEQMK